MTQDEILEQFVKLEQTKAGKLRRRWRFTLTNTHAGCAYYGEGSTRRKAWDKAIEKASMEFLTYKVHSVYWMDGFYACRDGIRWRTSYSWSNQNGQHVELRRV